MKFEANVPIYIQIYEFYKKLIFNGVYKIDDFIPSVREVALDSQVNPNTVVKAYDLLEKDKLIASIPKKGYIVIYKKTRDKLEDLRKEIDKLLNLGYTKEEILRVLKEEEK